MCVPFPSRCSCASLGGLQRGGDDPAADPRSVGSKTQLLAHLWWNWQLSSCWTCALWSQDKRNFLRDPPAGVQFHFDMEHMYPLATVMLEEDQLLNRMRFDLVPKQSVVSQFPACFVCFHLRVCWRSIVSSHGKCYLRNVRWCVQQSEGRDFLEELFLSRVSDQAVSSAHSTGSPAARCRWERGQCVSWRRHLSRSALIKHMLITNAKRGNRRKLLLKKRGLSHDAKNAFYQHPINTQLTKRPTFILLTINYSGWQHEM